MHVMMHLADCTKGIFPIQLVYSTYGLLGNHSRDCVFLDDDNPEWKITSSTTKTVRRK